MKTLLNTLFILLLTLTACGGNVDEAPTAQCVDTSSAILGGVELDCLGPLGCYEMGDQVSCDTEPVPNSECDLPHDGMLWCSRDRLLRCDGGIWEHFTACGGGCDNAPLRCF